MITITYLFLGEQGQGTDKLWTGCGQNLYLNSNNIKLIHYHLQPLILKLYKIEFPTWIINSPLLIKTITSIHNSIILMITQKQRKKSTIIIGWAVYPSSQVLFTECVGNHFRPQ